MVPRVIGSLAPGASVAVDVVALTDEATTAGDYAWTLHVDGVTDVVRVVLTVGAGRREPARLRLYGSVVERAADASLPRREPVSHLYDLVRDYPAREPSTSVRRCSSPRARRSEGTSTTPSPSPPRWS